MLMFTQSTIVQILIAKGLVSKNEVLSAIDCYIDFYREIKLHGEADALVIFKNHLDNFDLKVNDGGK